MSAHLRGTYRVQRTSVAAHSASKLFPTARDSMELRSHALKLAYWPRSGLQVGGGQVLDLDWEQVKGLPNDIRDVGELRVDEIGNHENIRIIFFKPDSGLDLKPNLDFGPLPLIWILNVIIKKRSGFTRGELTSMRMGRQSVIDEFYTRR